MKKAPSWLFTAMQQWDSLRELGKTFNGNDFDGVAAMKNHSHNGIAGRDAFKPVGGYCNEFVTWHLVKNGVNFNELPSRNDNAMMKDKDGDIIGPRSPTGKDTPLGRNWIKAADSYYGVGYDRNKNRDKPGQPQWWPGRSRGSVQHWWGVGDDFDWSNVPTGALVLPAKKTSYKNSLGSSHIGFFMGLDPFIQPAGSTNAKKIARKPDMAANLEKIWVLGGNQSGWVQPKDMPTRNCKYYILWNDYMDRVADAETNGAYYQHWSKGDDKIELPNGWTDWTVELIDTVTKDGQRACRPSGSRKMITNNMRKRMPALPKHYRVYPKEGVEKTFGWRGYVNWWRDDSVPKIFIHTDGDVAPTLDDFNIRG